MLLITPPTKAAVAAAMVESFGNVPVFESEDIEQEDVVEHTGEHLSGVSAAFQTEDATAVLLGSPYQAGAVLCRQKK